MVETRNKGERKGSSSKPPPKSNRTASNRRKSNKKKSTREPSPERDDLRRKLEEQKREREEREKTRREEEERLRKEQEEERLRKEQEDRRHRDRTPGPEMRSGERRESKGNPRSHLSVLWDVATRLNNEFEALSAELKKLRPEEQIERYKSIPEIRAEVTAPPAGTNKSMAEIEMEAAIELIEVL